MKKVNSRTRVNVKSNLKSSFIDGYEDAESAYQNSESVPPPAIAFHRSRTQEKHRKLGHCFLPLVKSAKIRGDRHWTENSRFVILNSDNVTLLVWSRISSRTHGKLRLWIPLIFCTAFVIRGVILDRKLQVEITVWLSGRPWSRIINWTLIKTLSEF